MKLKQITTAAIFGGFLFAAGPALAHDTINQSGTESAFSCSTAKTRAHSSINDYIFRAGVAMVESYEITSRHVGQCEKDGNLYLVDWSVTAYGSMSHNDADHTHGGRSRGDQGGTSSYGN